MADISSIKLPSGNTYDIKDSTARSAIPTKVSQLTNDSGFITGMTILSYGNSTWADFEAAYNANKVVYCRASSNANPASGSQTRLAFMAYVNNATTPTNVEFQYYRSVSSHTASQQGDQVFVYKLDKTSGWSVTTREASVKVVAGDGLGGTYSNGTMTLTGPTKVSDLTNDSGFITGYTETDPTVPSWAKASSKPTYTKSEVGLGNVDNVRQYSASNPPPYPVTSVNGNTGTITGLQTTSNLVTSVSSSSTNSQYPSAKLFYDTVGNIETLLAAI